MKTTEEKSMPYLLFSAGSAQLVTPVMGNRYIAAQRALPIKLIFADSCLENLGRRPPDIEDKISPVAPLT